MQYQVWVLDADYNRVAYLDKLLSLDYRVGLNQACRASINLPANDAKVLLCTLPSRLHIVRDGVLVWGGMLSLEAWTLKETAPAGDIWGLDALDYTTYLKRRTITRPTGYDFDERTGPADNVAKAYVYYHVGLGAAVARRFTDLTVQSNASACASVTKLWLGSTVLEHLQRLGAEQSFYWRIVPQADGCEFRTAYPLWGLDRSRGNGINDELVFAIDRHNVREINYKRDISDHSNYIYVGGAGEGKDQLMAEVTDAAAAAEFGRCELWLPATEYTTISGLEDEGARALRQYRAAESMTIVPAPGSVTPANLGDKCTAFERRNDRTFRMDAVITAIDVAIGADGVEVATPELSAT